MARLGSVPWSIPVVSRRAAGDLARNLDVVKGWRAISPNLIAKPNDDCPSEHDFYSVWVHFTGRKWCTLRNMGLERVLLVNLPGPDISLRNFNFCLRWDRGVDEFRRQRWQYVSDYMAFVHWVLIYTHMYR